MKKVSPRTLSGFMELLPDDQLVMNELIERLQRSYELFDFHLLTRQ